MKLGPKYKICRRVGDRVFGKCENPSFEMAPPKSLKRRKRGGRRNMSEYGAQLLEKQKMRYAYGVSEKQFSNYVKTATQAQGANPVERLYESLERRLDNTVFRMGLAETRLHARQIVSHGHITVNGRSVNVPSYEVRMNDTIKVKENKQMSPMYEKVSERTDGKPLPAWLLFDPKKLEGSVQGAPKFEAGETTFNPKAVIEFYSR